MTLFEPLPKSEQDGLYWAFVERQTAMIREAFLGVPRAAIREERRLNQMADKELLEEWGRITDPVDMLKALLEHSGFLGTDPYYRDLNDALLDNAARVVSLHEMSDAVLVKRFAQVYGVSVMTGDTPEALRARVFSAITAAIEAEER